MVGDHDGAQPGEAARVVALQHEQDGSSQAQLLQQARGDLLGPLRDQRRPGQAGPGGGQQLGEVQAAADDRDRSVQAFDAVHERPGGDPEGHQGDAHRAPPAGFHTSVTRASLLSASTSSSIGASSTSTCTTVPRPAPSAVCSVSTEAISAAGSSSRAGS